MKFARKLLLTASVMPLFAFGTSLHPDTFRNEVSPVLVNVNVAKVAKAGYVLKERNARPFTDVLIAIPATVSTGSVCTTFVGQETIEPKGGPASVIQAKGVTDPTQDACIEIFPEPIKTVLTVNMHILTGGFVPAGNLQKKLVKIEGAGLYSVELEMNTDKVTIRKMK